MGIVPQFQGPDGLLRETFTFTTTVVNKFFTGTIDSSVVELQVSIRGSGFSSDPDLVVFEGTSFTIPNPAAYPAGLTLVPGLNTIELRALVTSGSVSSVARVNAYLSQEEDLGLLVTPPSGVSLERLDGTVKISVTGLDDSQVRGYNFYASTSPGGGLEGYGLINASLVDTGTTTESVSELGTLSVDATIATNQDGTKAADPLLVRYKSTQEDNLEALIQTDFNERITIPETVDKIRTSVVVSSVDQTTTYSFTHDRNADFSSVPSTIPNGDFTSIAITDPLYYVVTAVYYDSVNMVEVESPFSPEVAGMPLVVTATIGSFPLVTRPQLVQDLSLSIFRSQPHVSIQAGSYTRDVHIDPISSETERLRFILDFLHRAQSFTTLLEIDDPNNTGESIAVEDSNYKLALKQAFFLTEDADVQSFIDLTFEQLASKFGQSRLPGVRSRGEVVIYTKRRPAVSIPIPIGTVVLGGSTRYRTTQAATIDVANIASFYSAFSGRYSVRVSIEAEEAGEAGDVAKGQINQFDSPFQGLSVINESETFGGKEEETNRELAVRVLGLLSSVDSGTEQGYKKTAIKVAGVEEVKTVIPGDVLMQRDFDPFTGLHRGGKVDVWIRGENLASVTDDFAFSFDIATDIQFVVEGDPLNLQLRALDPQLSSSNPILEMIDRPDWNYKLYNASTGVTFDLTDVEITAYNVITLSSTYNDPADLGLADVIFGDYRYRTSDKYVFSRQPVRDIEFFTGTVTGEVDPDAYSLYHPNSPLQLGRSNEAGNYLQLTEEAGLTIPSGDPIVVSGEEHVILGEYIEYLDFLGASPLTVVVYNENRTVEYVSPYDPSGVADYTIIQGTATTPLGIKRTEASQISSGETLSIDYQHDENFTVGYVTNLLVKLAQEDIDSERHITGDILVKEAISVPVDITATVVLKKNTGTLNPATVGADIITNITNYLLSLGLGVPVRQSDIIAVIEKTEGVSYVVTPLTKMVRQSGSQVVRENLITAQTSDYELLLEWSTPTNSVYLINDQLTSATTDGGGPLNEFRGVFRDGYQMSLITAATSLLGEPLNQKSENCFIIGDDGLSIPGYTDDATLIPQSPYITQSAKELWAQDQRKSLTSNRVLVVLPGGVDVATDEKITLPGTTIVRLGEMGIYESTIVVQNLSRTITYVKDVDYLVKSGGSTVPLGIQRIDGGAISSGTIVSVDYKYQTSSDQKTPLDYSFAVTYIVGEDSGAKNISVGETGYLILGDPDISYDEDQE